MVCNRRLQRQTASGLLSGEPGPAGTGRRWATGRASLQWELGVAGGRGRKHGPGPWVTHFQGACVGGGNAGSMALTARQGWAGLGAELGRCCPQGHPLLLHHLCPLQPPWQDRGHEGLWCPRHLAKALPGCVCFIPAAPPALVGLEHPPPHPSPALRKRSSSPAVPGVGCHGDVRCTWLL